MAENGAPVSSSAFFHIPTPEFGELHEKDGDLPRGGRAIDFAEDKPGFETRIVIPAKNRSSNTRSNVKRLRRFLTRAKRAVETKTRGAFFISCIERVL